MMLKFAAVLILTLVLRGAVSAPNNYCGDSKCRAGETCSTCEADCGICPNPTASPPTTPPPTPTSSSVGVCEQGSPNEGLGCVSDLDCGQATCSSNSDNSGAPCFSDVDCWPNNGNPDLRGKCVASHTCVPSPTPAPTLAPTPDPTTAPPTLVPPTPVPPTPVPPTPAPPTPVPPTPVPPTPVPPTDPTSNLVPYDLTKFQAACDSCRLQYPYSSPAAVNEGEFAGFSCDGFQLVNNQYIQFHISDNEGERSELRENNEWPASANIERSIQARMKIPQPDPNLVNQFTFLQIHSKDFLGNPDGPLLRVIWLADRNGYTDSLWACIRTSLDPKANEFILLQPRPDDFFDIKVQVLSSKLFITINGAYPNETFNNYDLSYWDAIQTNYFKAGAYLNTGSVGPVVTWFDELLFTV